MFDARTIAVTGACLSAIAVALGAFGAHALRDVLEPGKLETWTTGTTYLGWHAFALIVIGVLTHVLAGPEGGLFPIAASFFLAGIVFFCGSVLSLALGAPGWLGAVAPIGGTAFILGWIVTAVALYRALGT